MSRARRFLHEHKLPLASLVFATGLTLTVLAILGIPDDMGNEGTGPLASLKGWNTIIVLATIVAMIGSGYIIYRYVYDKSRFEKYMRADSQALFKRNQIEIERLALRLTSKEEKRVIETMKRYRIR